MRVGEGFCGIGGFRFGLEKANQTTSKDWSKNIIRFRRNSTDNKNNDGESRQTFSCIWANDWDKYACQIYRKHYGTKELVEGDVRSVKAEDIPDFDLFTAGFPCQSFSLAGKRQGFKDVRGTMFYEVARIAQAKRPKLLLLENVKGLLSNDCGRTFATILRVLDELGYDCEWQVLNSKHFGVPQNRERVFIIGHSRDASTRQIFPITEIEASYSKTKSLMNTVSSTLSNRYYKDGSENLIQIGELWEGSQCRVYDSQGISPTLHKSGGQTEPLTLQGQRIRRLTPTECERLQGFPDGWTEGISDTQRYKLLGNAVTTNVIRFLGERILEALEA